MRVYGDIAEAQKTLSANIPSYQPLAFAPPYGNYGQEGTNDDAHPRGASSRGSSTASGSSSRRTASISRTPGQEQPVGRLQVTRDLSGGELHEALVEDR